MAQQQGIALNQASQGGIIDDIDVEILDAAFCEYDYQGSIDHNVLALGIQFQDDNGKTYDQYYSAGELTYFVPSDDGSMAVPVADKSLISDSCNAWKLIASLMEVGGDPMNELFGRGNVKELVGLKVHVKQFAQPKRQGLIRGGKNADREPTVLLVSAILAWPGQTAAAPPAKKTGIAGAGKPVQGRPTAPAQAPSKPALGKPAGTVAPKATGAAPARSTQAAGVAGKPNGQAGASTTVDAGADDDKALAAEAISAILIENGGSVTKKDLAKLAFQKAGELVTSNRLDGKKKTAFVQLLFLDAFLHELVQAGTITFDGATLGFPG